MIKHEYLSRGLNAMARAHQMSNMAGHLGAAVVAGYFIGEQRPDLDEKVYKGIEGDLDRVIGGESVFGAKMKKNSSITDTELFAAFPKEKPNENLIDGIAEALEKNIDKPRESGHNVIFASIAIRALKEHPDLATPSVVNGIRKLILGFNKSHPGSGFYGKKKGRITGDKITLSDDDAVAPFSDMAEMAIAVLDEIIQQDPTYRRWGYGSLVHVNNHASAIVDLVDYGYPELLPKALKSFHRHFRLWKELPNAGDALPAKPSSKYDPHTPEYWTSSKVRYDSALLTHRVKTMFGFDELVEVVEDEAKRKQAYKMLRMMM